MERQYFYFQFNSTVRTLALIKHIKLTGD